MYKERMFSRKLIQLSTCLGLVVCLSFLSACAKVPKIDYDAKLQASLKDAESEDNLVSARGYEWLGRIYLLRGELEKAEDAFSEANFHYYWAKQMEQSGNMYLFVADIQQRQGKLKELGQTYRYVNDRYGKADVKRLYPLKMREALLQMREGEITDAEENVGAAQKNAAKFRDDLAVLQCDIIRGMVQLQRGNPEAAAVLFEKARKEAASEDFPEAEAEALDNLALAVLATGDVKKADEYAQQAMRLEERLGRTTGIGQVMLTQSMIALEKKDYGQSENFSGGAYRKLLNTPDIEGQYTATGILGSINAEQQQWGLAENLLMNTMGNFEYAGARLHIAELAASLANLGYVFLMQNKFENALYSGGYAAQLYKEAEMEYRLTESLGWVFQLHENAQASRKGQPMNEEYPAFKSVPIKLYRFPDLRLDPEASLVCEQ